MAADPANDGAPADPISGLAAGAAAVHELFLSYVTAGFSADQALYLTGVCVSTAMRGSPGGST